MSYRLLTAESASGTPKNDYIELAQQTINEQFYNASNVFTIQEETFFASGLYQNVDVRINGLVNPTTAQNIEDDFKKLTFQNLEHAVGLGRLYKFNDNFWLTTNVDKIKTLASTVIIRRCNNVLRWQDVLGGIYEVPCVLDYLIKENRDYSTAGSAIVVPSGMVECLVQFNTFSNKIKPNQRFLFGNPDNWIAYRVEGGGINNFNNIKTEDNTSAGFIKLSLAVDYVNIQTDDIVNGIANSTGSVYSLVLNQSSISGDIGQSVQLQATVILNEEVVTRTVLWESSDTDIATVTSGGLVLFIDEGEAVITCSLVNNSDISDTCDVDVVSSPVDNYQVIYSPNNNYVYEESEKTWTVYLYKNGVQQANTFVFVLDANTVPSDHYTYSVLGGNSFKVNNLERFLTDTLEITGTSGIYSTIVEVNLRGAW